MLPGPGKTDSIVGHGPLLFISVGGLLLLCLLLASCETIETRITENLDYFQTLSENNRHMIEQGQIGVGFTPREVYLAWGYPSHKAITETAQGQKEIWIYTYNRSSTFYKSIRKYNPRTKSVVVIEKPYYIDQEYVVREVVFYNGAVEALTVYPDELPYSVNRRY